MKNEFNIGEVVYRKADKEQSEYEYLVVAIVIDANGITYNISNVHQCLNVFAHEITRDKDSIKTF